MLYINLYDEDMLSLIILFYSFTTIIMASYHDILKCKSALNNTLNCYYIVKKSATDHEFHRMVDKNRMVE